MTAHHQSDKDVFKPHSTQVFHSGDGAESESHVQGVQCGCAILFVDIKTNVLSQYRLLIQLGSQPVCVSRFRGQHRRFLENATVFTGYYNYLGTRPKNSHSPIILEY